MYTCRSIPCTTSQVGKQVQTAWSLPTHLILSKIPNKESQRAGSTHIGFGPTRFSVQYVEQDNAQGSQACHRALGVNPLYAEGKLLLISRSNDPHTRCN